MPDTENVLYSADDAGVVQKELDAARLEGIKDARQI